MTSKQIFRKILIIPILASIVSACTGGASGYIDIVHVDEYGSEDEYEHVHEETFLTLRQFDVIDTYETNSEFDSVHLALSPYKSLGHFEVFWDIHSNEDYVVELRVNDEPTVEGSQLVSSEYCSEFLPCYEEQYQFCDYSPDNSLSCETPNGSHHSTSIDHLVSTLPQDMYIILQTCDTYYSYCEYQPIPVMME